MCSIKIIFNKILLFSVDFKLSNDQPAFEKEPRREIFFFLKQTNEIKFIFSSEVKIFLNL